MYWVGGNNSGFDDLRSSVPVPVPVLGAGAGAGACLRCRCRCRCLPIFESWCRCRCRCLSILKSWCRCRCRCLSILKTWCRCRCRCRFSGAGAGAGACLFSYRHLGVCRKDTYNSSEKRVKSGCRQVLTVQKNGAVENILGKSQKNRSLKCPDEGSLSKIKCRRIISVLT